MKRRLQVFVCSTYEDMRFERQSAVEAILKAGHIPAGMELFTAGSESQLKVIQQWIEDSDVFLLILGGRYGSLEPTSGLSYIEVEFDFARTLNKPFFSIVITETGLEMKVKEFGIGGIEKNNADKLYRFRDKVTSQMCAFFSNHQEVKLAIFETLPQFNESISVGGWVRASEVTPSEDVARQLTRLLDENQKLKQQNQVLENKLTTASEGTPDFQQLVKTLSNETVTIPAKVSGTEKPEQRTLLMLTLHWSDDLARGVANRVGVSEEEVFIHYKIASRLVAFGLVEHAKVPANVAWQRLKLSKEGIRFVTRAKINMAVNREKKSNAKDSKSVEVTKSQAADSNHKSLESPKSKRKKIKK